MQLKIWAYTGHPLMVWPPTCLFIPAKDMSDFPLGLLLYSFCWSQWDLEAWQCFLVPSWGKSAFYISLGILQAGKWHCLWNYPVLLSLLILDHILTSAYAPSLNLYYPCLSLCFFSHLYCLLAGQESRHSSSRAGVVLLAAPVSFRSSHSLTINSSTQRESLDPRSTPTSCPRDWQERRIGGVEV